HHLAVTRLSGIVSFYLDGTQTGNFASMSTSIGSSGELWIGGDPYSGSSNYTGNIMETRLWNVNRTAAQIVSTMNTTLTGNETGLVGYWRLDDGTGQVVNDYSTANNDG